MKLGLIGEKLPHSYSKEIFEDLLGYPTYDLIELRPDEVEPFLREFRYDGVNVTVPYKTAVLPYLDAVSDVAREIGAVNTVWRENGKLCGTNTDFYGLRALLVRNGIDLSGKSVLILGTGGTSKTAAAVCRAMGASEIKKVSRTGRDGAVTYEAAKRLSVDYFINTTPAGMFPHTGDSPIADPEAFFTAHGAKKQPLGAIDVIYNPLRTAFLADAARYGLQTVSGLYMLAAQAIAAERYFTGHEQNEDRMTERIGQVYANLCARKDNLVLIGMPAVGKTTVGEALAARTGRPFYDTDRELQKRIGSVPDFLKRYGEPAFREAEEACVRELTEKVRGAVIATGGGVILRKNNVRALGANGRIFWIDRPVGQIRFDGTRPLSDSPEKWNRLRTEREPFYRQAADAVIRDFSCPAEAAIRILEEYAKW